MHTQRIFVFAGSLVLADIPGLLEGAHEGVGLGIAFLRHIQRCRVLIHVVNGDSVDPIGDFQAINQELELFNPQLAEKTQVVVINKVDLPEVQEHLNETVRAIKKIAGHSRVVGISAATGYRVKVFTSNSIIGVGVKCNNVIVAFTTMVHYDRN